MEALPHATHQIFLSHSGQQKGFARNLFDWLSLMGYSVFFDQNDDGLPPGQRFAPFILSSTSTCKLAIVVISRDLLTSSWPMIELCAFSDRLSSQSHHSLRVGEAPAFTILPLFFQLTPEDLESEANLREWRTIWDEFELGDRQISAAKFEAATKLLRSLNGVVRRPESEQCDATYIEDVVDRIFSILPSHGLHLFRHGSDPHKPYVGEERLRQLILDTYRDLEESMASSSSSSSSERNFIYPCILGIHGVPGSGKSTLCDLMRFSMLEEFNGNVLHLELPSDPRADDTEIIRQYRKLLSMVIPYQKKDIDSMDKDQLYSLLVGASFRHKMFLMLDNISPSNYEAYKKMVQAILCSAILCFGSRVMLVARSQAILDDLLIEIKRIYTVTCIIMEMPCLTEEEATEIIRNRGPSVVSEDAIAHCLRRCSFGSSSSMYIPSVFEQIGILLRKKRGISDWKELEFLLEMVAQGKKNGVHQLIERNFKQLPHDLQVLFFDIALFIIPAGHSSLTDAMTILNPMHGILNNFGFRLKIMELHKHCALSVTDEHLQVHDIFTEYARSVPGNSRSYVFLPSLNISQCRLPTIFPGTWKYCLQFLEARTIIIRICKDGYDRSHNDDDDPVLRLHIELGGRAQLHALLFMNHCRPWYEKPIFLGLSGNFSSLVCFRAENMQMVTLSPCGRDANPSNLVKLELVNMGLNWSSKTSSNDSSCFMASIYLSHFISSGRMRRLRFLILRNVNDADIQRLLQNVCHCCPELEKLQVRISEEVNMDVRIEKAPKLKRLDVGGCSSLISHSEARHRKLTLHLTECPELQEIYVDGSFDRVKVDGLLPSKLWRFAVANDHSCPDFLPMNWVSLSVHQLSQLQTLRLTCKKVERLVFTTECLGCLPQLRVLCLEGCSGLTHLSMDPGCLPSMEDLRVWHCDRLQVLEGVVDMILMGKLEILDLEDIPKLRWEWDAMIESNVFKISVVPDRFAFSRSLEISDLSHVWEIEGIQHLCSLEDWT